MGMAAGNVADVSGQKINLTDLNMILRNANYLRPVTGPNAAANADCDLNGDGNVNLTDLNIVLANHNYLTGKSDFVVPSE